MKFAVIAFLLVLSSPAEGCFAPPREQTTAADALIERAENIVLAEVVEAKSPRDTFEVTYTLETVRRLKGNAPARFQITGRPAAGEGANSHFNHHQDEGFWSAGGGRSLIDTDCRIHPAFSVGGLYLVFLDEPYHVKSFEAVIRTGGDPGARDRWLQYVESRTGSQ